MYGILISSEAHAIILLFRSQYLQNLRSQLLRHMILSEFPLYFLGNDLQILLKNIQNSISEVVPKKKIGIAFSGGVDSTLVSKICTDMGFDVVLLTIGFSESHDIIFSKEVNEFLNYSHHVLEIDPETFPKITTDIHKVIDTDNLSWNENCIAFHYVSKLAKSLNLDVVITGNGIDELFCGYNRYVMSKKYWNTICLMPLSFNGLFLALFLLVEATLVIISYYHCLSMDVPCLFFSDGNLSCRFAL